MHTFKTLGHFTNVLHRVSTKIYSNQAYENPYILTPLPKLSIFKNSFLCDKQAWICIHGLTYNIDHLSRDVLALWKLLISSWSYSSTNCLFFSYGIEMNLTVFPSVIQCLNNMNVYPLLNMLQIFSSTLHIMFNFVFALIRQK